MHRRLVVVALTAGDNLETFLQSVETAAVEVVFEVHPGTAGAQVEIAEDHTAKMGEVGDAALAGADRIVESDGQKGIFSFSLPTLRYFCLLIFALNDRRISVTEFVAPRFFRRIGHFYKTPLHPTLAEK